MLDEDDEFGIGEEEIPPKLEEKWDRELSGLKQTCPSCGNEVDAQALLCLYCGNSTGVQTGVFGRLRALLTSGWGGVIFLLLLLVIGLFLVL